jgi:hypothetical protein
MQESKLDQYVINSIRLEAPLTQMNNIDVPPLHDYTVMLASLPQRHVNARPRAQRPAA